MDLCRPVVPHVHLEFHVFLALGPGSVTVKVGNADCLLTQETFVTVNPWEPHAYDMVEGSEIVRALVLYIDPMWLADHLDPKLLRAHQKYVWGRTNAQVERAAQHIVAAMTWEVEAIGTEDRLSTFVEALCEGLATAAITGEPSQRLAREAEFAVPTDFRIRRSLTYMRENIQCRMNFDEVAREAGLSRPRFFQLFRAQSGITPAMYWSTLRLDAAFKRLGSQKESLGDISFDLGFSSQSNFARFFVSRFNATPSEYRSAVVP
jgi:AraC-like DNA-binding protein